jgi:hypothetical protein
MCVDKCVCVGCECRVSDEMNFAPRYLFDSRYISFVAHLFSSKLRFWLTHFIERLKRINNRGGTTEYIV